MSKLEDGLLEGRPLVDGVELEVQLANEQWIPVRWQDGGLRLALSGEECALGADPQRVELRRAESPAAATRVMALAKWLETQVQESDAPVDLDLMRAHKKFAAELPRLIDEYQLKLRHHSFDLFHAASQFGAAHARQAPDGEIAPLRARLEETALTFEETSRWLSALQVMQADQEP
jgi:hypothetical protein